MLIFESPDVIRIFYEKDNEVIIHEWLDYNPENTNNDFILEILQKIYDIFLTHPVAKVIVKVDQAKGAFTPEVQQYIGKVQFPRILANTGVRYVATIHSEQEMKQMSKLLWQKRFKKDDKVILHDVFSEQEARDWLNTVDSV
ncbi:MAG: hypothetical protein HKN34_06795 [Gammaproteobacteria bacterium]|nr:hypothetical protein [Gammaproteobacteria bacterium]